MNNEPAATVEISAFVNPIAMRASIPISRSRRRPGVPRWDGLDTGAGDLQRVLRNPYRAALTRVAVPKKVVFGDEDDVFSRSSPYDTAKLIGAPAPTLIPGARHLSFISHPGQVAAAIITIR